MLQRIASPTTMLGLGVEQTDHPRCMWADARTSAQVLRRAGANRIRCMHISYGWQPLSNPLHKVGMIDCVNISHIRTKSCDYLLDAMDGLTGFFWPCSHRGAGSSGKQVVCLVLYEVNEMRVVSCILQRAGNLADVVFSSPGMRTVVIEMQDPHGRSDASQVSISSTIRCSEKRSRTVCWPAYASRDSRAGSLNRRSMCPASVSASSA